MRRSAFKSKLPPARPAKQYAGRDPSAARAPAVRVRDERAQMVVPIAKGPKAKPGKRTPTVDEKAWLDAIVAYGCIACRIDGHGVVPPAVHHLLRGGVRLGHRYSLPLCDPGHHQGGEELGKISRHPWKARFEQAYGNEQFLLRQLQGALGFTAP